jgi:hypothetical protein
LLQRPAALLANTTEELQYQMLLKFDDLERKEFVKLLAKDPHTLTRRNSRDRRSKRVPNTNSIVRQVNTK